MTASWWRETRAIELIPGHIFLLLHSIGGRETEWNVVAYTELRINVRADWYPLPHICVFSQPDPQERYPERPPRCGLKSFSKKTKWWAFGARLPIKLVENGVPYAWIIDPHTLKSELCTVPGVATVEDFLLRLPNTPIVIPLVEVMGK